MLLLVQFLELIAIVEKVSIVLFRGFRLTIIVQRIVRHISL